MNIKERINIKKEYNQHNSVLEMLTLLSYFLNVTDPLITPLIFIFLSFCREKSHDNKESSHKNSKAHCESQITTR